MIITKDTLVEDIVKIPGIIAYFIQEGVSPISCSGAFPMTLGKLLEVKKAPDPEAFIHGLNVFVNEQPNQPPETRANQHPFDL